MTWIQTREGYRFDLMKPNSAAIEFETIAVVLSRRCRFGGHSVPFYSVAQHSCLVADLVESKELKLPALLHDAHEVYSGFGDVLRPAKMMAAEFGLPIHSMEYDIDVQIGKRFGFDHRLFRSECVRHADNVALATEARDVMCEPPCPWELLPEPSKVKIEPLDMGDALKLFWSKFEEYGWIA